MGNLLILAMNMPVWESTSRGAHDSEALSDMAILRLDLLLDCYHLTSTHPFTGAAHENVSLR
jgi:hypothetical protein